VSGYQQTARRLLANNYLIVPIHPGQKRPMGANWQNARLSAMDVPRVWANGAGIGILCGVGAFPVYAVDIDVTVPRLAVDLERWCDKNLGVTCCRIGRAPKRLLIYRGEVDGIRKRASANWFDPAIEGPDGKPIEHHVEVLGFGQQFVAAGIHPDTQAEYQWVDAWGGVEDCNAAELPVLTVDGIVALCDEFERRAAALGWTRKGAATTAGQEPPTRNGSAAPHSAVGQQDSQNSGLTSGPTVAETQGKVGTTADPLSADYSLGLSLDEIKTLLSKLDPDMRREEWLRVIAAVKHEMTAVAPRADVDARQREEIIHKRDAAGYAAVLEWSRTGQKFKDERDVERRWDSLKRGAGDGGTPLVTMRWVQSRVRGLELEALTDGLVGEERASGGLTRRPRTEMGNAERLLDKFGAGLMHVPELKRWYLWTGVYWRKAMDVEVEHLAKMTVLGLRDEVELWPEGDEREQFWKWCAASQSRKMVTNMVALAASDPRVVVPASELDRDWFYLGVRNGVVDLRSGEFLGPDPSRRVTLSCGCEWHGPEVNDLWVSTVTDVFNDDMEMVSFFQRLVGYTLLGRPNEDVLVIPFGSGANGKSTLMETLRVVLGSYARAVGPETFVSNGGVMGGAGPRPDILAMRGARMVWGGEPDDGATLREGFIKAMTGGDPIAARANHSNEIVEIVPSWVVWMPTNHRPIVPSDGHAIWRRLMPVPFTRNFDDDLFVSKDGDRVAKLTGTPEALAGVLAWCVAGAVAHVRAGRLLRTKAIDVAREEYREDMDLLSEWLEVCCETGPDLVDSNSQIWASWEQFAAARGELRMLPSMKTLGRRLESRGFRRVHHSTKHNLRGFVGLRVRVVAMD
jgi:putative DNA primase/helicase